MSKDKDSSVIIVGNSPTIFVNELGEEIDNYDVVIRINNCPTEGFEKFTGSKTTIWATTKNTVHHNQFVPKNIPDLKEVWHRTKTSKERCKFSNELLSKPSKVMYKTTEFRRAYLKHLNGLMTVVGKSQSQDILMTKTFDDNLKDTTHEMCTGLITILSALLVYERVSILGFTFYTEQSDGTATGYYREHQKSENGRHTEDKYWRDNETSGFASLEIAKIKRSIILELIEKDLVRPLNAEEIYGNIKMEPI